MRQAAACWGFVRCGVGRRAGGAAHRGVCNTRRVTEFVAAFRRLNTDGNEVAFVSNAREGLMQHFPNLKANVDVGDVYHVPG